VIASLHPIVGLAVGAMWIVLSRLTGKAAVASIAAVIAAPIGLALNDAPAWEFAATVGLCSLLVIRHAGNIKRLLRREERSIKSQSTAP
jgi:glycerol-3-phosphate acyltransferase PlsY